MQTGNLSTLCVLAYIYTRLVRGTCDINIYMRKLMTYVGGCDVTAVKVYSGDIFYSLLCVYV